MLRSTYTFAGLEVSTSTFTEIKELLEKAGYHHAFVDEYIDMHGIGLKMTDRSAEICKNNYALFMERAMKTSDWEYKAKLIKDAEEASTKHFELTGKYLFDNPSGN